MPLKIFLLLGLLGVITASRDANAQWIQIGFDGGYVEKLSVGPSGSLYAGIQIQGNPVTYEIYRSTGGGVFWYQVNDGLPTSNYFVGQLFTDSTEFMYLSVSDSGLYRLRDGETTWVKVLETPYTAVSSAVSSSSGILFVGTYTGFIYRSSDSGTTWNTVYPTILGAGQTNVISLVRSITGRIIASLTEFRVGDWFIASDDSGDSWTTIGGGLGYFDLMTSSLSGSIFGINDNGNTLSLY
jgi:hypothetical protein